MENDGIKGIKMGWGVMPQSSVMGMAFIRVYIIGKEAPPGPFLIIAEAQRVISDYCETIHPAVPSGATVFAIYFKLWCNSRGGQVWKR